MMPAMMAMVRMMHRLVGIVDLRRQAFSS